MKHKRNATAKDIEYFLNHCFCWRSQLPGMDNFDFETYYGVKTTTPHYRLAKQRFYKNFKRRAENMARAEFIVNIIPTENMNECGKKVRQLYLNAKR